jgi:hypothetical protein
VSGTGTGNAVTLPVEVYTESRFGPPQALLRIQAELSVLHTTKLIQDTYVALLPRIT